VIATRLPFVIGAIVILPGLFRKRPRTTYSYASACNIVSQNKVASRGPDFRLCMRRPDKRPGWCTRSHRTPAFCSFEMPHMTQLKRTGLPLSQSQLVR
jgi:hypothetical protein